MRGVAPLLLVLVSFGNADTETATFFLSRAETAITAGRLDKAQEFIERALAEEEGFLPALVMRARLAQRQGKGAEAIRQLEAIVAKKGDARGSVEGRAIREAEAMLSKLDAARAAYNKLRNEYVERLLALAHESSKRKPRLATACYQQVLAVQPDNAEALKNLKMPAPAGKKKQATPKARGASLLNGKNLNNWTATAPCWTYKDKTLTARLDGVAQFVHCKDEVEGDYEYICELRVVEELGKDAIFALLFGGRGEYDHFGLWIFDDSLRIERQSKRRERSEYQRKAVSNLPGKFTRNDWHTYRIVHKAKRITVYVDGKEIFSSAAADRLPEGFMGLWAQNVVVELRRIAVVD